MILTDRRKFLQSIGGAAVCAQSAFGQKRVRLRFSPTGTSAPPEQPPLPPDENNFSIGWNVLTGTQIRQAGVAPANVPGGYQFYDYVEGLINAWCSGAERNGSLYVLGGGHNDYGGNEMYRLNIVAGTISRVTTTPSTPTNPPEQGADPQSDGNPASRHTYDSIEYDSYTDKLVMVNGIIYSAPGNTVQATWTFNFTTGVWTKETVSGTYPTYAYFPSLSYDPLSGLIYVRNDYHFFSYNVTTKVWTQLKANDINIDMEHGTSVIDPVRRLFIIFAAGAVYSISIAAGSNYAATLRSTSGDGSVNESSRAPAPAYYPMTGKIVCWDGSDSAANANNIGILDPSNWSWTVTSYSNGPGKNENSRGTFKRFRYHPTLHVFSVINSVYQAGYVLRIPPATQISMTAQVFYGLQGPATGYGISAYENKHTNWARNPLNGRLYSMGGDFVSQYGYGDSYEQEQYSFSIAECWANQSNRNAGWQLEYPYCGPDGGIQPKSPDFVGWTWDTRRNVFWMMPGTFVIPVYASCSDRTISTNDDTKYKYSHIMTFDPAKPTVHRWADISSDKGPYVVPPEQWMSHYDPVNDQIIRLSRSVSSEAVASHYNIQTGAWTSYSLGQNAVKRTMYIEKEGSAINLTARVIYTGDHVSSRLYRYNMDAHTMTDLGALPDTNDGNQDNNLFLAWDTTNSVLFYFGGASGLLYVYHPTTAQWETPSQSTSPGGLTPNCRHAMVYDSGQNVLAFLGNTSDDDHIYFYRYA